MDEERLIYDCEVYPNYWIVSARLYLADGTKYEKLYHHADKDDARKAFARKDCWYVGHNTIGYDDIMIGCWLDGASVSQLYELNQYLIEHQQPKGAVEKWIKKFVRTSEWVKYGQVRRENVLNFDAVEHFGWKDRKQLDTLILGEKQGSLKNAAIVLGCEDLREAPVQFGSVLTAEQMLEVDSYCWHDVDVTDKLLNWYKDTIEVRRQFYEMGIKSAYVVGSAKLAELYLLKRLENEIGTTKYLLWKENAKRAGYQQWDLVSELIGKYKLTYNDSGFAAFWDKIKDCELTYFDGVMLKNVDVALPKDEEDYEDWLKKMKEPSPYRTVGGAHLPKGDMLITDEHGWKYMFGVGGLHNVAPRGLWKETADKVILNVDVKSYYPSLIRSNKFSPRQFREFSRLLGVLLDERLVEKEAGNKIKEQALKLVLNSSFGKTKDSKSIMCDPKCHFSTTVSGQLLLLRLIDLVYMISPRSEVINANTDGVCFYVPRYELDNVKAVTRLWENFALVKLEYERYDVWAQSTCNLYCALQSTGKVKSKGRDFKIHPTSMRETMSESPAVKQMLTDCLLYGKHPNDTAKTIPLKDFCMSANFGGKRTLMVDGVADKGRRALRFMWVKEGSILQKLEKRGLSIVGEGRKCQIVDDFSAVVDTNIDREYYVQKVMSKILGVVGNHKTHNLPAKVARNININFEAWYELAMASKN